MSLAVSAVVKPSLALFILTTGMCVGILLFGLFTAVGLSGDFSTPIRSIITCISIVMAFLGFYSALSRRIEYRIDISGTGQIRLLAMKSTSDIILLNRKMSDEKSSNVLQLLAGSTIWPGLMLLRLRDERGGQMILPILFDSVSPHSFRALSVACRWIALHKSPAEEIIL